MDFLNTLFWTIFNTIIGIFFAEGPIGTFLWNLTTLIAWFLIIFTFFGIIFLSEKLKPVENFFIQRFETLKKIHYFMQSNPDDGIHIIDYGFILVLISTILPTTIFLKIPMWLFELFSSAESDWPSFWKIYLALLYFVTLISIPVFIYRIFLTLVNANTYDGERKDGKMHGQGKLVIKTDSTCLTSSEITYIGKFKNGFRHGLGKITLGNGEIYEGEFVDGLRHGNGKEISSDRRVTYEGEWRSGEKYKVKKVKKPKNYWTKEKCQEEARKYYTRTEFRLKEGGAYSKAYKNGWLDTICKHMNS